MIDNQGLIEFIKMMVVLCKKCYYPINKNFSFISFDKKDFCSECSKNMNKKI